MATRLHFNSVIEWVAAAAVMGLIVLLGSIAVREFRNVSALLPVSAREPSPPVPPPVAGVPARSVSVPVILLTEGKEIRVGDSSSQVESRLDNDAQVESESVEHAQVGERVIRSYQSAGRRFILTLEPFEPDGEPRVSAIYVSP